MHCSVLPPVDLLNHDWALELNVGGRVGNLRHDCILVLAFTNFRPGPTMSSLRGSHHYEFEAVMMEGLHIGIQHVQKET
jgi:hypothetical protein